MQSIVYLVCLALKLVLRLDKVLGIVCLARPVAQGLEHDTPVGASLTLAPPNIGHFMTKCTMQ